MLLSYSQAGPGRKTKHGQEEISRNHVQTVFSALYIKETDLKTDINVDTTSVVAPSSMGRSDCTALVATRATLELDLFFFCPPPPSARKMLSKMGSVAGLLAAFFSALR